MKRTVCDACTIMCISIYVSAVLKANHEFIFNLGYY